MKFLRVYNEPRRNKKTGRFMCSKAGCWRTRDGKTVTIKKGRKSRKSRKK